MNDKKKIPLLWKIVAYNIIEKFVSFRKKGKLFYKPSKQVSLNLFILIKY